MWAASPVRLSSLITTADAQIVYVADSWLMMGYLVQKTDNPRENAKKCHTLAASSLADASSLATTVFTLSASIVSADITSMAASVSTLLASSYGCSATNSACIPSVEGCSDMLNMEAQRHIWWSEVVKYNEASTLVMIITKSCSTLRGRDGKVFTFSFFSISRGG